MGGMLTNLSATLGSNVVGQDSYPIPGTPYEKAMKFWLGAAYEEAEFDSRASEEVRDMQKSIDYICGKQWPGGRAAYKSKPIDNRIWRLFWESIALLTDTRPIIDVTTFNPEFKKQASILKNCTKAWWLNSCADLNMALIVTYALLSTGFAKIEWDETLRHGEGDFNLLPLGPNDVLLLKPKNTLESAQCVIYKSAMPLSYFVKKNAVLGKLVRPDPAYSTYELPRKKPAHLPERLFDGLSEGMKRMLSGPAEQISSAAPMALSKEFWFEDLSTNTSNQEIRMGRRGSNWEYMVKPGDRLYPRGRLVHMGGDVILYDGPNPWWHGTPPFADLRLNIVPWQYYGLSDIKPLIPLQDIINNILAGVMDMVKKAVNPGFMGPKNAFSEQVWNTIDWAMPGYKAMFSPTTVSKPDWAPTPNIPGYVMQVVQLAMREMDETSVRAVGSEAMKKKQVPSGDTLDKVNQGRQTKVRLQGRRIESMLQKLGEKDVYNIFQCYDKKRRVMLLGPDGKTREDFDWDPDSMVPAGEKAEDHVKQYSFYFKPGSLLALNHDEKRQELYLLAKMGKISNRTLWANLDHLEIDPDKEEALLAKQNQQMPQPAQKGNRGGGRKPETPGAAGAAGAPPIQ